MGRDVHVSTTAAAIASFMENDRSAVICYRCGQPGHVRVQCLTYKVRMCYNWKRGACNDEDCTFAHGESEMRTPWRVRCVRVVKQGNNLVCIGCNSAAHTFRRCPLYCNVIVL
jgi:hypothetical protein